jgi:hypothetical protein
MTQKLFANEICNGKITDMGDGDMNITGSFNITESLVGAKVYFWAAAPPTYGTSYYGSGHPYANPIMAYDGTPNKGMVEVKNGTFNFNIKYPNAYYIGLGSLYVPPHVNLKLCVEGMQDKYFNIQVDNGIPFRTLTYPSPPSEKPRTSPLFYHECMDTARSQESILRASGYPEKNEMPTNFWGLRPPR